MSLLGHVISKGGITVNPLKVNVVLQWETPKSVTDIRSFLSLAGYYNGLIYKFFVGVSP